MLQIQRHDVDSDYIQSRISGARELLGILEEEDTQISSVGQLNGGQRDLGILVACRSFEQPDWKNITELLQLRTRIYGHIFDVLRSDEGTVETNVFADESTTFERVGGPVSTIGTSDWRRAFWCAVICRDPEALEILCDTPTDAVRNRPGTTTEESAFHLMDALRGFQTGDPDTPEYVMRAMEATDPERVAPETMDYIFDIIVPQIETLFRLLDNDQEGFNTALGKAVSQHKSYYSTNDPRDPKGFISLDLTGLCAYAFERDVAIQVESDYIPKPLYTGEYL